MSTNLHHIELAIVKKEKQHNLNNQNRKTLNYGKKYYKEQVW